MAEQIITKICRVCKQTKPISEFYKVSQNRDGYENQCKQCHLRQCGKYQKTERGKMIHRFCNKRYGKTKKGKVCQQRYYRSKKGKIVAIINVKRYNIRYPDRVAAGMALKYAIRAGKLPRSDTLQCFYCPKPAQQYHHWHGYEPKHHLDVIPLCIKCHFKLRLIS